MKALLLALLLNQQLTPSVIPINRGALVQLDGGIADVRGGAWFSEAEIIEMGKDHAGLRAENEVLRGGLGEVSIKWVAVSMAIGAVLGAVAVGIGIALGVTKGPK